MGVEQTLSDFDVVLSRNKYIRVKAMSVGEAIIKAETEANKDNEENWFCTDSSLNEDVGDDSDIYTIKEEGITQ